MIRRSDGSTPDSEALELFYGHHTAKSTNKHGNTIETGQAGEDMPEARELIITIRLDVKTLSTSVILNKGIDDVLVFSEELSLPKRDRRKL